MSDLAIGSSASFYSIQNTNTSSTQDNASVQDDFTASNVNGDALAQPLQNVDLTTESSNNTNQAIKDFLQNIAQSLQGTDLNAADTTSNIESSADANALPADTSSSDVNQSLNTFLYDLYQTLNQSSVQPLLIDENSADGGTDLPVSSVQNGYSNFATNLDNLVASLNNNSDDDSHLLLQTDFNNIVSALGGSTSELKLQDFLQAFVGDSGNSDLFEGSVGSLLDTQA